MQIIKTERDGLLRPLQTVAGIVEKRTTLPILSNVLIRKQDNTVTFTGTDAEMQVRTSASIGTGGDAQATTVSARKLMDILRSLGDGEVNVDFDNSRLRVKSGKSRFTLQTLAADGFPTIAVAERSGCEVSVSSRDLRELLQQVHFAMAQQDIRFFLNGLLLVLTQEHLTAVATDGHRLAYAALPGRGASGEREVIIPRKTVLELMRLLPDSDEQTSVEVLGQQLRIGFGDVEILTKLVEGKFPDYRRVIQTGYSQFVILDRDPFARALARVSILTNEKFRGVRLTLAPSTLRIQSTNAEQEEASEELEVDYDGQTLEVGFNVAYLLDVLANLRSDSVKVEFGEPGASALISRPQDETFKYVIMPMRI